MEDDVVEFDKLDFNDASKSYDGQTYKAPQSDDQNQGSGQSHEQSQSPSSTQRISRGSSDQNNCVKRTVTAIKRMNENAVNTLKDQPLNKIIKQVWKKFMTNRSRCKQILMALFNKQPDPTLMTKYGFGEWAKEQTFVMYKKAMAKLKQLILDNMKRQKIRLYLLNKERINEQRLSTFLSYICQFLWGDFWKGTIPMVHSRREGLLIRQTRDQQNREDEEMGIMIPIGKLRLGSLPQQQ